MFVIALVYFIDCMSTHELTVITCEFWDLMHLQMCWALMCPAALVHTHASTAVHSKTQNPHVLFFVLPTFITSTYSTPTY